MLGIIRQKCEKKRKVEVETPPVRVEHRAKVTVGGCGRRLAGNAGVEAHSSLHAATKRSTQVRGGLSFFFVLSFSAFLRISWVEGQASTLSS